MGGKPRKAREILGPTQTTPTIISSHECTLLLLTSLASPAASLPVSLPEEHPLLPRGVK